MFSRNKNLLRALHALRAVYRRRLARKGAVLLLVLGAVALLSILAMALSRNARLDVNRSVRLSREAAFRRAFDSGMEVAKGLLIEKRSHPAYDYWGDGWQETVKVRLSREVSVSVRVADESGKFNLKTVTGLGAGRARKMLARLFDYLRAADPRREEQWRRAGEALFKRLGLKGGGSSWGPLFTLDGLREAGIPLALVFGPADEEGSRLALCDVLTLFGGGKINLNTAPEAVLYALDEAFNEEIVEHITAWRGRSPGGAAFTHRPFRKAKDLEMVEGIVRRARIDGKPVVVENLWLKVYKRLSVKSRCFSARLEAFVQGRRRRAWAFFEVGKGGAEARRNAPKLTAFEELEP